MKATNSKTAIFIFNLLVMLILPTAFVAPVLAHGGEDHGDEKKLTAVSNQKGMVTRTARAGDFEVMLKHAALEPDTETSARLFITRYDTNESFGDAKPEIEIVSKDGKTFEASEVKSDAPGSYNLKIPPLPEGAYTVLAKLSLAGKSATATFSGVSVEHPAVESPLSGARSWSQTALIVLAALAVLSLLGGLMYFVLRLAKSERISDEAVST